MNNTKKPVASLAKTATIEKAIEKTAAVTKKAEEKTVAVTKKAEEKTVAAAKKAEAKTAEVKKVVKPVVKKAAAKTTKAAAEVKTAAKKTVAKATKKTTRVSLQFAGKDYSVENLEKIASDVWVYDCGRKASELKDIELYVKPEENKVYYVFNAEVTGSFEI